MRLLIQHKNQYKYPKPAALGPQLIRLRPANHTRAKLESYSLTLDQPCQMRWQQDPHGNHIARVTFLASQFTEVFSFTVELCAEIRPVNPFDFFLDSRCDQVPFVYPKELLFDLAPFFTKNDPAYATGARFDKFLQELPTEGHTVSFITAVNQIINQRLQYVIREETGIWTPEETLAQGKASCRDSAVLLVAALRARGLAARFVSGYLVQLTDEGLLPDLPKGVLEDVVDLHAWAEVYLPGAGWIGLDATSGLLCGEGHIPLACVASPQLASPLEGTSDTIAESVSFSMKVARLGHEPRPTTPYQESTWQELLTASDRADEALRSQNLTLTSGGEPTFNSREHPGAPEWNDAALGPTKWSQGLRLAKELQKRLAPGGVILYRMGKHYPGESLPRFALDLISRKDGAPLWKTPHRKPAPDSAQRLAKKLSQTLGLSLDPIPAYEDPWRFLQEEERLPLEVDPLQADLKDPEERKRLAKVLTRGLGEVVGYVIPIQRQAPGASVLAQQQTSSKTSYGAWQTEAWKFKRGNLFLLPGDSPIGLRLPLRSLVDAPIPEPKEEPIEPKDPRRAEASEAHQKTIYQDTPPQPKAPQGSQVRTALCIEQRGEELFVFLPPVTSAEDFISLLAAIEEAAQEVGAGPILEGYAPPKDRLLRSFSVTPDPGVLEVNLPPSSTGREYANLLEQSFEAALYAGLHCEKYLLDGRQAGSGGGNHITLGGETPLSSPFAKRSDLLASLITFVQHHPSLSYMFTGLFVGPTSQAPRVDEARHDALYELEIALSHAFSQRDQNPPPWLSDFLFRNLLVDVAGNTHRAEISLDKLFDPNTSYGRQGLIELRAFEMPPHFRMAAAQMILVRSLLAAFAKEPYQRELIRFGQTLHDRYLLPYWMWRDFEEVLAFLQERGLPLPEEAYEPFVALRCPLVGQLHAGDITLEVRNAIEPWHVLGEELTTTGTARFVDSSMERVEVRVRGLLPERYSILVNGCALPMRPTKEAHQFVGGVRFRAWAPPHSLQPHLGIHHPLRFDVFDRFGGRSLGSCSYHVWHPEGRAFDSPPLTRFEAAARRAQRFTIDGPTPWPIQPRLAQPHPDAPYTLDLRRYPMDHPMPEPGEFREEE